jgi:hypothetical protein
MFPCPPVRLSPFISTSCVGTIELLLAALCTLAGVWENSWKTTVSGDAIGFIGAGVFSWVIGTTKPAFSR